ncbi:hypothetical protein F7P73_02455 [Acinetobacter bohemicus]|uniref:Uncharacterized protein n=1 Tax=Acinetobacter bohemicus TaxID=1435036 RepID=A0A1I6PF21_9GAMM|nr:hypothetical protein [Acinetobacter bohemicus]KAB0654754.1 hypothetical protein F7P73_02455 [Acinetobacter bohemicus]SFS38675.1 hypothetical protein SAMN05444586_100271 [Acinetobacter bohemicus]
MLQFWYSDKCTRQIKLMVCIATCIMIYLCSTMQQLSAMFIGISLMIGMGIHLLRALSLKIAADHPYKNGFALLFWVIPFTALMTLIAALPTKHKIMLILQTIGFTAIGLFILSTFPNRKFDQS